MIPFPSFVLLFSLIFTCFCSFQLFLLISTQSLPFIYENIPESLWPILHEKITNQIFDVGSQFSLAECASYKTDKTEQPGGCGELTAVCHSQEPLQTGIYLIDHLWTFAIESYRRQLEEHPGLLPRLAELFNCDENPKSDDISIGTLADKVGKELWKHARTYSFSQKMEGNSSGISQQVVWYVQDEFGVRIRHSDSPNVKIVPMFFVELGFAVDVMWVIEEIGYGREITRDYAGGVTDSTMRSCKLHPWIDNEAQILERTPEIENMKQALLKPDEYFEQRFHIKNEVLPEKLDEIDTVVDKLLDKVVELPYRVFTDWSSLRHNLDTSSGNFCFEKSKEEANIHWLMNTQITDFKAYQQDRPAVFINQIPNESIICNKDLLAEVLKRIVMKNEDSKLFPDFCKPTFDLSNNFPEFMSFALRENISAWIVKPVNFSNAMGIVVTDDIKEVVRYREQSVPLIAQEYVSRPILFKRTDLNDIKVKFDVRWMVWVSSVKPLKLYISKIAWPRFANRKWEMNRFHEFEQHMSYQAEDRGGKLITYDFDKWEDDFCGKTGNLTPWATVRDDTYKVIKELFVEACENGAPKSLEHYSRSRAHYGIDVIYEEKEGGGVQPVILECNFNPDCTRIMSEGVNKYRYADYYNHMFDTLFVDDTLHPDFVHKLC